MGYSLLEDVETSDGSDVDHQDLRLWLRMMALHKLILNELRRRLRTSFGMSLARFDLLSQLDARAGIRMGALSDRLMVTTGNITGLVDELEADGLVERMPDPESRRALLVRLTPKGRKQFNAAAKRHESWVREFFSVLSENEKKILFDLVGNHKAFVLSTIHHTAAAKSGSWRKRASPAVMS
ncbi:MAG: MarR family transcriptional regulator [Alphaproteobacteria bacterium]|nr:MarR family transcriptional regulator [Alphaproteobacteria bacterium]